MRGEETLCTGCAGREREGALQETTARTQSFDISGSFHRKLLPDGCISFSSMEGIKIFQEALHDGGVGTSFFNLIQAFQTQGYYSFCGLGSLTMALNSLLIDPHRKTFGGEGVWRWFDESMV